MESIKFHETLITLEGLSVVILVILATGSIIYEKKKAPSIKRFVEERLSDN